MYLFLAHHSIIGLEGNLVIEVRYSVTVQTNDRRDALKKKWVFIRGFRVSGNSCRILRVRPPFFFFLSGRPPCLLWRSWGSFPLTDCMHPHIIFPCFVSAHPIHYLRAFSFSFSLPRRSSGPRSLHTVILPSRPPLRYGACLQPFPASCNEWTKKKS